MYLSDLVIINYRSCRKLHLKFEHDYPNVLIGINDCGKSTVLQAIGLLLNPKLKFNYLSEDKKKSDISNTHLSEDEYNNFLNQLNLPVVAFKERRSFIFGRFILESSDINDGNRDALSNHLKWVISKTDDNSLWLGKVFDEEQQQSFTYLLTPDTEDSKAIYSEKDTRLRAIKNELGISNDEITNANQAGRFANIELICAIYSRYQVAPQWAEYTPDKKFWLEHRYLDWNITLEQLNQFANDVVSQKIDKQIELASIFARRQASKAQTIVNSELMELAKSLRHDLHNIKSIKANVSFQVTSNITDLLVEKENSDGEVHLDSQGDGVKRQLWFALIKWNAMKSVEDGNRDTKFLWCFDEPETHLYPKAQREFYEIIKKVSLTSVQSIISTHSTVFIDRAKLKSINKFDLSGGYTLISKCSTVDDIYRSLQIKNSDFLFYDKFLIIEGDTEQFLIPSLYEKNNGKTLIADNIQLINLGGKSKRAENGRILESIIDDFSKETSGKIVYFLDNDARSDFTAAEFEKMKNYFLFGKQDLEDAISSSVWHNVILDASEGCIDISIDEIEDLKSRIPVASTDETLNQNQKFYRQLSRIVDIKAEKLDLGIRHVLPTKGSESGKLLSKHIADINEIAGLAEAFQKLQDN